MSAMRVPLKRFRQEFHFYSSQLVIFFIVIIFLTSGSLVTGIAFSLIVVFFMLIQMILLSSQGHMPILRFLFSLITPLGYSILRAATSSLDFTETTNILLWGAAVYIGLFQAISISFRPGFIKRIAEIALSFGSAVIFFAFYYYLDMRLNLHKAFLSGQINQAAYDEALKISRFLSGFRDFAASPQHLFALLGIASFDVMLLGARMKSINLKDRMDRLIERGQAVEGLEPQPAASPKSTTASRQLVSAISSDIIGFTAMSEMLGAQRSAEFLNKYYALWTHLASAQGGRVMSINGDTVIILFGLADERVNPERALASAYAFMDELESFREDLASMSIPADFKVSIGVHTGTVISALLGSPGDQKRNVFGDTIAVAARLDSLCRELHQELLVSHSTFRRLSLESQASLDRIGEVLLRQSTRPVPVYTRK
jgi:class 3 adenylate cyclase